MTPTAPQPTPAPWQPPAQQPSAPRYVAPPAPAPQPPSYAPAATPPPPPPQQYAPPPRYAAPYGQQPVSPPQQYANPYLPPAAGPQYAPAPQYGPGPAPQYGPPAFGAAPYAAPAPQAQPYRAQPYGQPYDNGYLYGQQPYAYPTPPARKRGAGRLLLVLLAVVVAVGIAVPTINALNVPTYANETYSPPDPDPNPPKVPTVANEGDARQVITANALYNQTIPYPTRCVVTTINLSTAPETELNDHMSTVIGCLMRVWDDTVSAAGYQMPRPPLVIYSSPISSGCGKLATLNAAYCSTDQKIYYATDLPKAIPSDLRSSRFVVEMVVAHEFGHAVQARTAILAAGHGLEGNATNDAASREWSRRIELQADCFAGLFIRSVSKSAGMTQQDLDNIASLMTSLGDDTLGNGSTTDGGHGLGSSRKYWAQLGLASTSVGVCNTFAAPSEEVR